jgi:hypothetical protein
MSGLLEGIRGIFALVSIVIMGVFPIVIAVTGYLSLFHELSWLYLLMSIGVWFLGQVVAYYVSKEGWGTGVVFEGVGGGTGWVWMLSVPTSIWFLVSAVFMDGSWSRFFYSFLAGAFAKSVSVSFNQSLRKWQIEREGFEGSNEPIQGED